MPLNYESLSTAIDKAVKNGADHVEIIIGSREYRIDIELAQKWLIDLI